MRNLQYMVTTILTCFVISCSTENPKYVKSPLDDIITKYINEQNYSVILADMDYKEDSDTYFHKYQIIIEKPNETETTEDDFDITTTDWQEVSPITFEEHLNDLGMTVLSKKDGELDKLAKPAGYSNYVGNEKYGHWQRGSNGSSFWAFYGQYAFMSAMLGGGNRRYYRNDYDDYRNNHRGRRGYYGTTGKYGTSTYNNPDSNWNSKPKSFKQKVRSQAKQSSSAMRAKGYSSSRSYGKSGSNASKNTRNGSRYNSSSSSRSRSGGFGK